MVFKAERPKQAQAQGNTHILGMHKTIANTIKNSQGKHQTIADIALGTSSTNDA
jgi:hypothetical protein